MTWDGEPNDVPGQCNARLYIGDDYGDNTATMRCQLAPDHQGPHTESFTREEEDEGGFVCITWERDERPGRDRLLSEPAAGATP